MTKKILYFDMDGVLVDYPSGIAQLSQETQKEYEGRLYTNLYKKDGGVYDLSILGA